MLGLSKGNPGALTALIELEKVSNEEEVTKCCGFLHYHRIKGSNIYLIWNDLCGRDTLKFKRYLLESAFNDGSSRGDMKIC